MCMMVTKNESTIGDDSSTKAVEATPLVRGLAGPKSKEAAAGLAARVASHTEG